MTILVTGATGNVGRLVVDRLLAAGATQVRALTNKPAKAVLPPQVEVVEGYLGRPQTLAAALAGVERMYLAPLPETVEEVVGLAAEAGVRRIVDLSGDREGWWGGVATAVEKSGLDWTHLCPGEFMINSQIWADQIRDTGMVRDCDPLAINAPIALEDIADVATLALLEDRHVGEAYDLTGPEALSRPALVEQIGAALGTEIPYVEISRAAAIEQLTPAMCEYAGWYVNGRAELVGHPQAVSPTFEQLLGRRGMTFAEWAVANADEFRGA